jgi:hypothetical protein
MASLSAALLPAQLHIEGATAAMAGMGGLKSGHVKAEFRLMQPFGYEPAQPPLPLGRVKVRGSMKRVPRKRRLAFASNHQH